MGDNLLDRLRYEARDYAAIDNLIKHEWTEGTTLWIKCWNRDEANHLSQYVQNKYPHVNVRTSWLNFDSEGVA